MNYEFQKVVSSGGLGDSLIVNLKLREYLANSRPNIILDWFHYESNPIVPKLMNEIYNDLLLETKIKCQPIYEKYYVNDIKKMKDEWKLNNIVYFNTSVNGKFDFPAQDEGLQNPFLNKINKNKNKIIVIHKEAGAKNSRKWPFDIERAYSALKMIMPDYKIVFLSSEGIKDENLKSMSECIKYVQDCSIFIGLSGFWTYFTLANRINTIFLQESEDHNKHYLHPKWQEYMFPIQFGSLTEITSKLNSIKNIQNGLK